MRICVGQILGAHGVKGLVKLASFTDDPEAIAHYGDLTDEAGARTFAVTLLGFAKDHWLAKVDGVNDRDAADALKRTQLFVDREKLPPPDEDEFYHADLIGLRAELPDGTALGTVSAMLNFGAGDIVEIALPSGKKPLVPFDRETVPEIDMAAGRLVIDPPPGLAEELGLKAVETGGAEP
ncbi:MAG TPA: ribosome maturation factor RimM [Alphaproteobacteria bacterium]|jgi:16S rRNA processing protein RimM|nr:ribosome maturation factor RimM [Alphaproteobacteria bacterium]